MGLETATYISDLVATNPAAGDPVSQGDDHARLTKSAVLATFPNINAAVILTDEQINLLDDKSLAASGYQKLPSGLIIQWGNSTSSGAGAQSVTFPTAFPSAVRSVTLTPAVSAQAVFATTEAQAASSFTFSCWTLAGARAVVAAYWFAVGY